MKGNRLVSIDPGNTNTKVLSSTKSCVFPSVSAIEQGALKFKGLRSRNDLVIEFEGERVALGESAYRLGRLQVQEMGRSRLDSAAYRRLIAGGLASVLGRSTRVTMVASLPVKFYTSAREEVRKALSGRYEVVLESKPLVFEIHPDDLHLVPEAFGTLCLLILDTQGQVRDETLIDKRVGVVDIGGRTTDCLMFDNLELVPTGSFGLERMGVSELWALLGEQIEDRYGRSLTSQELDQALRSGYFKNGSARQDIRGEVEEACVALADAIAAKVNSEWDGGKAVEKIILTGGAAPLVGEYLPWPHSIVIEESLHGASSWMANVVGDYLFGIARGWAD